MGHIFFIAPSSPGSLDRLSQWTLRWLLENDMAEDSTMYTCNTIEEAVNILETALITGDSPALIIFDHADMKTYEQKVRDYFGEYSDEILSLYPASSDEEADRYWAEIYGAVFFDYPHYCLNRLAAENKIPVYEYYFSKTNGRLGNWHSGEEVYCYGNIPDDSALYDSRDRELSAEMLGYWKNFITNGDPNGEGLPKWTQNTGSDSLMSFPTLQK